MKNISIVTVLILTCLSSYSQPTDTVVIPLARTSKIIFTIQDKKDIETLRHYNFQALFNDVLNKLDSAKAPSSEETAAVNEEDWSMPEETENETEHTDENDNGENNWHSQKYHRRGVGRTWQSSNVDIGINNYLADGQFPSDNDPYVVRPWGSWYVGLTSLQRTRVGKHVFFEWGLGVSWYSFKFEDDDLMITRTDDGLQFSTDTRDVNHIKSKLSATFINASFVPLLDLGDHSRKPRFWDGYGSEFRMGVGPYVGYRIGSKTKLVYEDADGDKQKEKDRDSYHLNNLRYGIRLQLGFNSTDFFINYDLNELFVENKGPKVNAVSFGLIF
jgi:hypothetical protein